MSLQRETKDSVRLDHHLLASPAVPLPLHFIWQTSPGLLPSSRTLSRHVSSRVLWGSQKGTACTFDSPGLVPNENGCCREMQMPPTYLCQKSTPRLQNCRIISSWKCTASTPSIEIQSNAIKTSWQPPGGHRCPGKWFWGCFPWLWIVRQCGGDHTRA